MDVSFVTHAIYGMLFLLMPTRKVSMNSLRKEDCYIRRKRTVPVVLALAPSVHACSKVDNILLDDAIESEESNCTSSVTTSCHADEEVKISTSNNN
jgi:hypothetical protein